MKVAAGFLLLLALGLGLAFWLLSGDARFLQFVLLAWAIVGMASFAVSGVFDPLVDGAMRVLGAGPAAPPVDDFAPIEAMVGRGEPVLAAEEYRARAADARVRTEALLRRAELLAGPLGQPGAAAAELEALRDSARLAPADDVRVGLALVDLYDHRLGEPGRAMAELRRLLDRDPEGRQARQLRAQLAALKARHFGDAPAARPPLPGAR